MTFSTVRTEILDRLGQSSTDVTTRVGRLINQVYREVTTEIGLNVSRRSETSMAVTADTQTVVFTSTEKIERLWVEDDSGNPTNLREVTLQELRQETAASSDEPTRYAILSNTSSTITVLLDVVPDTAFNLFVDKLGTVADLSGSNEPAFPESFHDILVAGVLVKEYRRKRHVDLAREEEATYEKRLSGLRMWIAKSITLKYRQRDAKSPLTSTGVGGGAGSATLGQTAYTQTGLITFTRGSAVAPFAVSNTDATYVVNLGAEFLGNITTDRLIGRDTAATGESEQLTVGGGIEFTGSGGIQTSALTGDVTKAAGGTATTIAALAVETGMLEDDAVTFAKMQNIATDRLLGRDTASTGNVEELTVGGGVEFSGSTGIQRSALTGDVTASAGSNATTIANDAVTYAKLQDVAANSFLARAAGTSGDVSAVALAASQLAGRGSAGNVTAIVLGTGLSMSSDTLNATGTNTDTQLADIKVYTANDTWSKPAGLYAVVIEVVGGGGGGGGIDDAALGTVSVGGGGGGGYSRKHVLAASLGSTETVTIGAAGTAGASGGGAGGNGGTSSFGAHASATGGTGNSFNNAGAGNRTVNGIAGGIGSSGDVNVGGSAGGPSLGLGASNFGITGSGGSSVLGGGGLGRCDSGGAGGTGAVYGGGGGGALSKGSSGAAAGGAGAAGIVIVYEYVTV